MNAIRATQALNKRELENAVPPSASWHADYRDTAYVYIGGLPLDLSEGDVVAIFSQYGNPTHLNLIRDKETGKSKGFAFLKYEDQRSCDLAVDNLGGAEVFGRLLRVDHTRYKKKDGEDEDTYRIDKHETEDQEKGSKDTAGESDDDGGDRKRKKKRRIKDRDGRDQLRISARGDDTDEEDPMRDYGGRKVTRSGHGDGDGDGDRKRHRDRRSSYHRQRNHGQHSEDHELKRWQRHPSESDVSRERREPSHAERERGRADETDGRRHRRRDRDRDHSKRNAKDEPKRHHRQFSDSDIVVDEID